MNAEKLLDALSFLPDDLLTEVDTLRQRKPAPRRWKRLVPIAACLALVVGALVLTAPLLGRKFVSMKSTAAENQAAPRDEAVAEAPAAEEPREVGGAPLAPEAEETVNSSIQAIPVTAATFVFDSAEPEGTRTEIISSLTELENSGLRPEDLRMEAYDEEWFRENQLIFVLTDPASSSIRYDIHAIHKTAPGCWELVGTRFAPEWQTEDMVPQLILVELPRMVEPEDTVLLNLTFIEE